MVIDAFIFFNELALLELRLEELNSVVDFFVIVESGETFSGKTKPYVFEENRARFSKFERKIIYYKVPKMPPLVEDLESNRFKRENFQRNVIFNALTHCPGVGNDDCVVISDIDEIPSCQAIELAKECFGEYEVVPLLCDHYRVSLRSRVNDENAEWCGPVMVKYALFSEYDASTIRYYARALHKGHGYLGISIPTKFVKVAGWHFSYFGGEAVVKTKVANFSHGSKDSRVQYDQNVEFVVMNRAVQDKYTAERAMEVYGILSQLRFVVPGPILANPGKYDFMFS